MINSSTHARQDGSLFDCRKKRSARTKSIRLEAELSRGLSGRWVAVPSSHPLAPRRLIESQLFGVGVIDPASYGSTVLLFGVVAVLACLTPARAATRVDPVEAFDKAQALDSRLVVSSQAWNSLCWAGALGGHPAEAMEACDKAVTLSGRPSFRTRPRHRQGADWRH